MSKIHSEKPPSSDSDNEIYYTKKEMIKLFNKYARKLSYEVFTNGIQTPSQSLDFTIKWFEQNKKK